MSWIKVFKSNEEAQLAVPDKTTRLVKIRDARICLVNHQDNFYAFEDRCPHMGASLSEGIVNYLGEVICPLHEYRFNPKTGQEADQKCRPAKTYTLKVESEGVFIELPE